jgi:hypothetical protein
MPASTLVNKEVRESNEVTHSWPACFRNIHLGLLRSVSIAVDTESENSNQTLFGKSDAGCTLVCSKKVITQSAAAWIVVFANHACTLESYDNDYRYKGDNINKSYTVID